MAGRSGWLRNRQPSVPTKGQTRLHAVIINRATAAANTDDSAFASRLQIDPERSNAANDLSFHHDTRASVMQAEEAGITFFRADQRPLSLALRSDLRWIPARVAAEPLLGRDDERIG